MAHDQPDIGELILTVQEFLSQLTKKLDGQDRYYALCSSYLLEIVQRELTQWAPVETDDDKRLRSILSDNELPRSELPRALSEAIREGQFDDQMDAMLAHLIDHVTSKVEVTKPSYLVDTQDN
ncbi:MAG: DUF6285 domain-containing protein [Gammaproteobacteria bacterium]